MPLSYLNISLSKGELSKLERFALFATSLARIIFNVSPLPSMKGNSFPKSSIRLYRALFGSGTSLGVDLGFKPESRCRWTLPKVLQFWPGLLTLHSRLQRNNKNKIKIKKNWLLVNWWDSLERQQKSLDLSLILQSWLVACSLPHSFS